MSALLDRQFELCEKIAEFIKRLLARGYKAKFGYALRCSDRPCVGHPKSLHRQSLAVDLLLFKNVNGSYVYLTSTDDYLEAGEIWESMGGSWGGRFSSADGNHFSLEWEGMR